ncbi:hypothetical protein ACIPQ1_12110 [Pseudomonas sp. LARHCG127]|uniref:hypothetical protein n=1 Tax=unclassified Pseudomonas TaxID=196821 RepID=UPI0020345225|nr:hypothetical protein [Pseudomonas sp. CG7]MCM2462674.1 hypothetical protein [Pseudomonas sp. CG7]
MSTQIATAALEQSAIVEDISHRISDIREISEILDHSDGRSSIAGVSLVARHSLLQSA